MCLVINKCVTAVILSNFSRHYLRNRSTSDIGFFWLNRCILTEGTFSRSLAHSPRDTLYIYIQVSQENVPQFGRAFLMLKYTDITQNNYVQSWTVTEIMAREKCGLLVGPRTVSVSWQPYPCPSLRVVSYYGNSAHPRSKLFMYYLLCDKAVHVSAWHSCHV